MRRSLILLFALNIISCVLMAQARQVTGTVVDGETGESLIGVGVAVKGTTKGTSTDARGKFTISVPESGALIFKYVGYISQTIDVAGKSALTVKLKSDNNKLNEVVVIGYGAVKKADITGSVGIVDLEDLTKAPVANFEHALAGRIAGVQVSSADGQPGEEGYNIVIRGAGSLTQSNAPLYVIDGFPIEGPFTDALNPDDIASINVLKDASATAIYGARGANGVIIVETKKGKTGPPVLTYSGSFGFQKVGKTMDVLNPYDFVRYQLDARGDAARAVYTQGDEALLANETYKLAYIPGGKTLESYRNVEGINWQDALFQKGSTSIHNIALRGGTDKTKYSISGSIFGQDAVVINTGYDKYQGRVTLDQTINNKIQVGVNANYSTVSSFGQRVSDATVSGSASSYLMYAAWGYRPVSGSEEVDIENELGDPEINHNDDYRVNPRISVENEYLRYRTNNLISNIYGTYKIHKNLTFKMTGGINSRINKNESFYNSKTAKGNPVIPSNSSRGVHGSVGYSEVNTWSSDNTLTFNKTFNKVHSVDVMGGFGIQKTKTTANGFTATQVPNESLGVAGLRQGIPFSNTSNASESSLQSLFARANYDYKSKYLLTATMRLDASSKFASHKRNGYFPSGAFAWRMSNEDFMRNISFISDAKLRVSHGATGNNRVGDNANDPLLDVRTVNAYAFDNQSPTGGGVIITNLGNQDMQWETTVQSDIGYDLSLFKGRLEFTADVYRKTTKKLLLQANLPYDTGFPSSIINIGKVQNQGLELSLNTINFRSKAFSWETNFNISFNNSKVLALNGGEERLVNTVTWETQYNSSPLYITKVGEPIGQFYGYIWDGVYQVSDFNETAPGVYTLKNSVTTNATTRATAVRPGDIKYRDINNDGVINTFDQTVMGRGLPIHTGGFQNNFSYKGFNLGVFFQWSYGNDIYNANRLLFEGT